MRENEPNDLVQLTKGHPHQGSIGTLVERGPYGPPSLNMVGWKVELDSGSGCYAQDHNFINLTVLAKAKGKKKYK